MLSKVLCLLFIQFENWIYLVFEVFTNFYCILYLVNTFPKRGEISHPFPGLTNN